MVYQPKVANRNYVTEIIQLLHVTASFQLANTVNYCVCIICMVYMVLNLIYKILCSYFCRFFYLNIKFFLFLKNMSLVIIILCYVDKYRVLKTVVSAPAIKDT